MRGEAPEARVNAIATLRLKTRGPGLTEFTGQAARHVVRSGLATGLLTLHVRHTSCSLLVQENADPDVRADLLAFFRRIAPAADDAAMDWITHRAEGPDDMPAHIRAALTQTTLSLPVHEGRMTLGTWQGLYLFEHRERPHERQIVLHAFGDAAPSS